ncbi:hypothetical protein [Nonomuraea sp. JJY05]|uniref:hypothetical protein n=1 Tax=Nonomuraea sp. JJY05 TaxID=3350255 RepID=UPI00373EC956
MDSEPHALSAEEDWQRQSRIERRRTQRRMCWYVGVSAGSVIGVCGLAAWLNHYLRPAPLLAVIVGTVAVLSFLIHWIIWFRHDTGAKEGHHRRPLGVGRRQPGWKTVMWLSALSGAIVAWPISRLLDVIFK